MPKQVTAENENEFDDLDMAMLGNYASVQHKPLQVQGGVSCSCQFVVMGRLIFLRAW
jgi:hypothetical protein